MEVAREIRRDRFCPLVPRRVQQGAEQHGTRRRADCKYRNNPDNVPGYVSPCAGGQPGMSWQFPGSQN